MTYQGETPDYEKESWAESIADEIRKPKVFEGRWALTKQILGHYLSETDLNEILRNQNAYNALIILADIIKTLSEPIPPKMRREYPILKKAITKIADNNCSCFLKDTNHYEYCSIGIAQKALEELCQEK